ncbi:MAG: PilZ domain-containing protein [Alphaproteobacteria bacterium]
MYERYPCPHHAQAFFSAQWRDCAVDDISAGGANILTSDCPAVGESVTLFVEDVAEMPGGVVRHTGNGSASGVVSPGRIGMMDWSRTVSVRIKFGHIQNAHIRSNPAHRSTRSHQTIR